MHCWTLCPSCGCFEEHHSPNKTTPIGDQLLKLQRNKISFLASDPVSSWSENRGGLIWNAIAHERKFKISKLDQIEHLCRKNTSPELVQPHIRHIAGILFVMNHPQGNCLHTVLRGRHILQLAFKRFLIKKRHVAAGKWWNVKHALKRKPLISLVVH